MSFAARALRLSARQVEWLTPPFGDGSVVDALMQSILADPPRLEAEILAVKRVDAGAGVSYGHTFRTTSSTTLALVAIGYGHGLPRKAGNRVGVTWGEQSVRMPIVGRVAMDVLVVDAGDHEVTPGEAVVFFGDPGRGEFPVTEWCESIGEHPFSVLASLDDRVRREVPGDQH